MLTLVPGKFGGTETHVRGLLNQFARGMGPDEVTVLANRGVMQRFADFETGPVRLFHVRAYPSANSTVGRTAAMAGAWFFPERVRRSFPLKELDLVHYPLTVPIPLVDSIPTVVALHDIQHEVLPEFFSRAERIYRRRTYYGGIKRATVITTGTNHSKQSIVECYGVPTERIVVVPNGVDRQRFSPEPALDEEELIESFDLPERFVIYPANLWPHKNHDRLLEAFSGLQTCSDLQLILTGATYSRLNKLMRHAQALGLEDRVQHLGYLSFKVIPAVFRRALAMVFPSLHEGFGIPVIEAMASGLPVVLSNIAPLPEVGGDAGLYFDPHDPAEIAEALERVADDKELRATLKNKGFVQAKKFTWELSAKAQMEAYRMALET